ncbi:MAG: tetratricopeptide repeat protein, partial [Phycisphaerae bacterium]|nr:tetratricopeptide repeat protein [Phycisphaerae bacterium]
ERKNVLSGLFYLLAMLAYLRFDESRRKAFYFTALVCFILALLSKTVTCTLPVVLLLLLWLRHRRVSWSDLLRLIPFFAAGAFLGMFTAYLERHQVGAVGVEWQIAFWQRWVIAGRAVFFYVSKLLCPIRLTFIYPRWNPTDFFALDLLWPAAAIVLTIVLWSVRKSIGRAPLVAWAGFIITLFPALGFFDVYPFRFSFVADHFQYLASIFSIALVVGASHGLYKRFCGERLAQSVISSAWIVPVVIILVLLGWLTHSQASIYEKPERLWLDTLDKNPRAWMAWNNLGLIYNRQGRHDSALRNFNEVIQLKPTYTKAYNNMAQTLIKLGRAKEAVKYYRWALQLRADRPKVLNNLAWILATHKDAKIRNGAQAVRLAERACQLESYKRVSSVDTLAAAYAEVGQFDQAVKTAEKAMQLARAAKSEKLAKDIRNRLELYKAKRPHRELFGPETISIPEPK